MDVAEPEEDTKHIWPLLWYLKLILRRFRFDRNFYRKATKTFTCVVNSKIQNEVTLERNG
jgi:hypothetical protein